MPFFDQLLFQLRIIINLTIVDQNQRVILVLDGLLPILQSNDTQTPHTQTGRIVTVKA